MLITFLAAVVVGLVLGSLTRRANRAAERLSGTPRTDTGVERATRALERLGSRKLWLIALCLAGGSARAEDCVKIDEVRCLPPTQAAEHFKALLEAQKRESAALEAEKAAEEAEKADLKRKGCDKVRAKVGASWKRVAACLDGQYGRVYEDAQASVYEIEGRLVRVEGGKISRVLFK